MIFQSGLHFYDVKSRDSTPCGGISHGYYECSVSDDFIVYDDVCRLSRGQGWADRAGFPPQALFSGAQHRLSLHHRLLRTEKRKCAKRYGGDTRRERRILCRYDRFGLSAGAYHSHAPGRASAGSVDARVHQSHFHGHSHHPVVLRRGRRFAAVHVHSAV